jgi:uroporphyrinogen decarboxylase
MHREMTTPSAFDVRPDFARIRCALKRGEPDRVPLAELLVDTSVMAGFLGRPIATTHDVADFYRTAGYDFVPVYVVRDANIWTGGRPPKEGYRVTRFHRSANSPEEQETYWRCENAGWITSLDELDRFPWPDQQAFDLAHLDETIRCLPDGMKAIGIVSLHEWAIHIVGSESFLIATIEQPEFIREILRRIGERIVDSVERASRLKRVGAVWVGDDLAYKTGLLYSPEKMRDWLFPWYRKIADIARSRDLPLIFHSDGDVREIIPDLIQIGFDALHPIEPNAMDIVEIKRKWGKQLCLIGNIDLSYTLPRGTLREVEAEVRQRLRECAPGGGYCLSSANSVPEYVPVANYRAMVEATLRWGKYPIRA